MIKRIPLGLQDILTRIEDPSDAFTFSRWGDGEWQAIAGARSRSNRDGHRYFPEMGKELRQILLEQPDYVMGMQGLALRVMGDKINTQVKAAGLDYVDWVDSDVFHQAALNGHLYCVVNAVNTRKVLLVGPPHLRKVNTNTNLPLHYWEFVEVSPKNAYLDIERVIGDIEQILAEYKGKEPLCISVSASLPAGIILHRIYPLTKGRHTVIDFGCLWDPLAGVITAGYHKEQGIKAIVEARSTEPYITEVSEEQ
tara:strand:+ start:772 stop:1530 length:759 start_codon:yes stop_codon:yes gene_type:complete